VLAFEGVLFRFKYNAPSWELLFQLPPTMAGMRHANPRMFFIFISQGAHTECFPLLTHPSGDLIHPFPTAPYGAVPSGVQESAEPWDVPAYEGVSVRSKHNAPTGEPAIQSPPTRA